MERHGEEQMKGFVELCESEDMENILQYIQDTL